MPILIQSRSVSAEEIRKALTEAVSGVEFLTAEELDAKKHYTRHDELYRLIDFANGEIRIQAVRYGGGGKAWYCLVALTEQEESMWEKFEDLVGGDNDYFEATKFFEQNQENFFLAIGETPEHALELATEKAARALES